MSARLFTCTICTGAFEQGIGRPRKYCTECAELVRLNRSASRYVQCERGTAQRACSYCTQMFTDTTGRRGRHSTYCSVSCRTSAQIARSNAITGLLGPPKTLASHKVCNDCRQCKPRKAFCHKTLTCLTCSRERWRELRATDAERERRKTYAGKLTDSYVHSTVLRIPAGVEVPPGLIKVARLLVQLRRVIHDKELRA